MNRALVLLCFLALLEAGCSSVSRGQSHERGVPQEQRRESKPVSPAVELQQQQAPVGNTFRKAPEPPSAPAGSGVDSGFASPTPLDLDRWPFGWVSDSTDSLRLGLPLRFWSDQKSLWSLALDLHTPSFLALRQWEKIQQGAKDSEEAFRASWHLWLTYRQAGLYAEARSWLDKASEERPGAVAILERAWDQAFRLSDLRGARALWTAPGGPWFSDDDRRKVKLLRQHLFLGAKSFSEAGADDYVSDLILDRDDLWVGTWNGAVIRWSLPTGSIDLLLGPGNTVAPVKLLASTGWFVYAFQDQNLQRYSKVTGVWRTFSYPSGWTGLRVQAVVADGEESLWVAYLGQGLWHWSAGQWTLIDDGGGGPFLNALASDGQGGFWIGTKDRGLWSWKAGIWTPVPVQGTAAPLDISVIQVDPAGSQWAVGTWGEGAWILSSGRLRPLSLQGGYITAVTWTDPGPVWGTLDGELVMAEGGLSLGPLDGLPGGGVSSLVSWEGRWIWGTTGQGLGWWTEYENPSLLR